MSDEADDRQAIIDLALAYVRLVDGRDFDGLRDVFTPDATADLGGSGQEGVDEICERLSTALSRFESWTHQLGDHDVDISGDMATARCSVHAVHVCPAGQSPPTYTVTGTYEDRLARTSSGWRITHRSLVVADRY